MLGVERDASARSIKVAYRALARRYHPDHNPHDPEAEEHFKRIQEAYGVLSDRRKRAKYDHRRWGDSFVTPSGHAYRSSGQFTRRKTGEPNPRGNVFGEALGAVGGLFNWLFGNGSSHASETSQTISLSLEQALRGGPVTILLPNGSRARVAIPENISDGFRIRLKTPGSATAVHVKFAVKKHPRFGRRGPDLEITETINALEATLGVVRTLETPYSTKVAVRIPPGTSSGKKLRVKGQGVHTGERTGDLVVTVVVDIPRNLDARQREILRKAAGDAGLL